MIVFAIATFIFIPSVVKADTDRYITIILHGYFDTSEGHKDVVDSVQC